MHRHPLEYHRLLVNHRLLTCHQLHMRQPRCVYQQRASLRLTSRLSSTTVVLAKIAASPSRVSVRGTTTSRVATSRGSSTLSHRRKKRMQCTTRIPLAPLDSRQATWRSLHQPEKYDGTVNPTEFLQIYSTSILATGRDEAVMTSYFPMALTRTTRSWLMNLPNGMLTSWQESCHQFTTNFESAYSRPGNETNLHTI
jgi:hypothetical protein